MLLGNIFVSALAKSYTVPQKKKALSWDKEAITIIKSKAERSRRKRQIGNKKGIKTKQKKSLKTQL